MKIRSLLKKKIYLHEEFIGISWGLALFASSLYYINSDIFLYTIPLYIPLFVCVILPNNNHKDTKNPAKKTVIFSIIALIVVIILANTQSNLHTFKTYIRSLPETYILSGAFILFLALLLIPTKIKVSLIKKIIVYAMLIAMLLDLIYYHLFYITLIVSLVQILFFTVRLLIRLSKPPENQIPPTA